MTCCFGRARWLALALVLSWTVSAELALAQNDESAKDGAAKIATEPGAKGNKASDNKESVLEAADPFKIPEGNSAELLQFLKKLLQARPVSPREIIARRDAFKAASEKILKLEEKTPKSKAAGTARGYLFQIRLSEFRGGKEEASALVDDLTKHFEFQGGDLDELDVYLATTIGRIIEQSGNAPLAAKAYRSFAKAIAGAKDKKIAAMAARLDGFVRRLNLLGNKMEIKGTTVDGKEFGLTSYRGKFVLVEYWATWCIPCVVEMPHLQRVYDLYHQRGFEIVGISLNTDRRILKRFLGNRKIPWITLFKENAFSSNANADRYGVQAVPMGIFLDQEGKAISLDARGAELDRLLEKHLGAADAVKNNAVKDDAAKNKQSK